MKRLCTLIVTVLLTVNAFAQAPQKMSYQAVIRNSSNQLVINHTVGMKISILQGSSNGIAVYTETQTPSTNANGLVTIEFGGLTGFAAIDWPNGPYFIKTETDPTGGTNYTIIGTSQILSIPYALYAKTADYNNLTNKPTLFDGNYNSLTNKPILFDGTWASLTGKPSFATVAISGNYADLSNKPILFDGTWASLTGKPTTIVGYGITDFDISGAATNDLIKFNGSKWVKFSPNFALTTHTHSDATTIESGFLSVVDKTKLDNLKNADGSETKIVAGTNISISGSGTNTDPYNINATNTSNNQYYIGQLKDGGIIFYIYRGSDGLEHGLIVSLTQIAAKWQNTAASTSAIRGWDGAYNTNLMTDSPAKTFANSLGAGWYIPSIDELVLLWHNRYLVNRALSNNGSELLAM